jgi:glyoxylase-like metal-dependent hydrolase (beta-lactamase superfamily II)
MEWFDLKQVFDDVYAFMEPGHFEEAISYLVIGNERAVLVDTGMAVGDMTTEARKLTELPLSVVNTHAHWDHRGENHKFSEIAIHSIEARDLEKLHSSAQLAVKTRPGLFTRPTPPGFSPETWQVLPSQATRLLKDGDTVELGGRTLEVIHTPGHTPGHVCLLNRAQRWLMTGDVYYPGALYLHLPYSNPSDFLSTARKLAALEPAVDWVLPSHNQTPMPATELGRLADAMEKVMGGNEPWEKRDTEWGKVRRYDFGNFSVWLPP